jgi:hypothetical protein
MQVSRAQLLAVLATVVRDAVRDEEGPLNAAVAVVSALEGTPPRNPSEHG